MSQIVEVGAHYEAVTVGRESGGNAQARNPRSSATGPHQFLAGNGEGVPRSHPELGLTQRVVPILNSPVSIQGVHEGQRRRARGFRHRAT